MGNQMPAANGRVQKFLNRHFRPRGLHREPEETVCAAGSRHSNLCCKATAIPLQWWRDGGMSAGQVVHNLVHALKAPDSRLLAVEGLRADVQRPIHLSLYLGHQPAC